MIFATGSRSRKIGLRHDGSAVVNASSDNHAFRITPRDSGAEFTIPGPPAIVSMIAGLDGTITLRGTADGYGGDALTGLGKPLVIPAGTLTGDLMLMCVALDGVQDTPTVTGWTAETTETSREGEYSVTVVLFSRTATSGDHGTTIPDFGGTAWNAQLRVYAGATLLGELAQASVNPPGGGSSVGDPTIRTPVAGAWHRRTDNFITGLGTVLCPVIHGSFIYWFNWVDGGSGTCKIGRANLDGTGVNNSFITGITRPRGPREGQQCIAIDSSHIYWTESGSIGRANLDGTGVSHSFITLGSGQKPASVACNSTHLFWTDRIATKVARSNLDGSSVDANWTDLTPNSIRQTTFPKPLDVAATDDNVFWTDAGRGAAWWPDGPGVPSTTPPYEPHGFDASGAQSGGNKWGNDFGTGYVLNGTGEIYLCMNNPPRIVRYPITYADGFPEVLSQEIVMLPRSSAAIGVAADSTYYYYGTGATITRIERASTVSFFAQFFAARTDGQFTIGLTSGSSDQRLTGHITSHGGEMIRMASEDYHTTPPLSGGVLTIDPDPLSLTDGESGVLRLEVADGTWAQVPVHVAKDPDFNSTGKILVIDSGTGEGGVMIGNF